MAASNDNLTGEEDPAVNIYINDPKAFCNIFFVLKGCITVVPTFFRKDGFSCECKNNAGSIVTIIEFPENKLFSYEANVGDDELLVGVPVAKLEETVKKCKKGVHARLTIWDHDSNNIYYSSSTPDTGILKIATKGVERNSFRRPLYTENSHTIKVLTNDFVSAIKFYDGDCEKISFKFYEGCVELVGININGKEIGEKPFGDKRGTPVIIHEEEVTKTIGSARTPVRLRKKGKISRNDISIFYKDIKSLSRLNLVSGENTFLRLTYEKDKPLCLKGAIGSIGDFSFYIRNIK